MRQTNYHLFDFMEFDPTLRRDEYLWRAIRPTAIAATPEGEIEITLPFQRQKRSNEMEPDRTVAPRIYQLRLSLWGDKIMRTTLAFDEQAAVPEGILQVAPDLHRRPLHVECTDEQWSVRDDQGTLRAVVNFIQPPLDHWSDLLPTPEPTFDLRVYPDGKREVRLSAYDQFSPPRHDALALAFVECEGHNERATLSLRSEPDEIFVGTGERFAKLDLAGRTFALKNQDGQGVNNRRCYKNVPLYLSSRMYGAFLHTSAYAKLSLADHSTRSVQWLCDQPLLDLFLLGGESWEEILYQYRRLTGFPTLPPLWSFGTWMSRMTYFSADEINLICDRLRNEHYPCDVIHIDTGWFETDWLCEWKFNAERFPDPKEFIGRLRSNGFKVSLWQLPYISYEAEQHDEAAANNYFAPLRSKQAREGSNFSALDYAGTIDFTSPAATEWYKELLRKLLRMGVVCIKTDFGENIHMDADYANMAPELLNNIYGLLYQKAAYEVTQEETGDGIIWARSGWAGCQRYPLHWGGDSACSWDGLAGSLRGGIHLGLSGFAFWSHDVPGFHSIPDFMNSAVDDTLYVRWTQFGVFSSHLRYHGTSKREPWCYPAIENIVRRWWKLRYALIPYLYEQSIRATQTGYPIIRALMMHHIDDRQTHHIDDQYYFGDDILVAPVINDQGIRDIYLPEGKWVNLFDGSIVDGERWIKRYSCPLDEMPVWIRFGASLSVYPEEVQSTDDMELEKAVSIRFDNTYKGLRNSIVQYIFD